MSVSIKQMRYVLALARSGHFGRAAEACAISQSALSQQIQSLEAACSTPLFDRLKAGVRPTPFGLEFIALARTAIEGVEALEALLENDSTTPDRTLRFGLIPTVAPYLLPDIFPTLTAHFPNLTFSESRTDALLAGIEAGNLDLALIATEPPSGGIRLAQAPLFDDPFVLATPKSQTVPGPVTLSALLPDRMLLLDEGHCFRDQAIAACGLDGSPAGRTFAATSLSTIVEFVANGQGVTLLPSIAMRKEASDPRIAIHPLAFPGAMRTLSLIWREATPFAQTYQRIAEIIRSAYRSPA